MKTQLQHLATGIAAMALAFAAGQASASAIITNGVVTLGVNDLGHLNIPGPVSGGGTPFVGLRYNVTGNEATAPGCLCEGWGVGLVGAGTAGFANVAVGTAGLSLVSFASTATTATSVTDMAGMLRITHFYHPSSKTANLYAVDVKIENISGSALAAGDLVYRRVMDWDVEPTAFSEFVTIAGVPAVLGLGAGNNLKHTSDNGFQGANPLSSFAALPFGCPVDANFTDCGPADHGALFDFEFGALAAGAAHTFTTYYGATGNEADALAALAAVGAGLYSLGQASFGAASGEPNTFIFGFGGAGGVLDPVPPTAIPEPASLLLLGLGALALSAKRRRR